MTFAFLILGDFSPEQDRTASIGGGSARMIGVPTFPLPVPQPEPWQKRGSAVLNCAAPLVRMEPGRSLKPPAAGFRWAM